MSINRQWFAVHPSQRRGILVHKSSEDMGIEHITSGIRKPTTLGNIERLFNTYKEELSRHRSLEDAVRFYNDIRIHQSPGYRTPIEVYQKSHMS